MHKFNFSIQNIYKSIGGEYIMTSNNKQAKEALNNFKMEVAREVGVNLKQGYNGDLTSKQAGTVGGMMVKKMIEKVAGQM